MASCPSSSWREGIDGLRSERIYALPTFAHGAAMTSFSPAEPREKKSTYVPQKALKPRRRSSRTK